MCGLHRPRLGGGQTCCVLTSGGRRAPRALQPCPPARSHGGLGGALHTRCEGQPIALGLARHKGPSGFALRTYACFGLLPVHPLPRARYREAFPPSRAQDDPTDAARQLAWLRTHRDTLPPRTPPRPTRRALKQRVDHRRRGVGDTVPSPQRLTRTLQNSFPHARPWWQDKAARIFGDVRRPWPPLQPVPRARRSLLEPCLRAPHGRAADVMTQRLHAIKAAIPWPTDAGLLTPPGRLGPALLSPLRATWRALQDCAHALPPCAPSPPACPLCPSLPGAGPLFAPRLRVACGAPRHRSASAAALQQCAGLAPVTKRRGQKGGVHGRLPCPPCRRHTGVEGAAASLRHAFGAPVYSQQQREPGKAHQGAVRALACQWLRLLFRGWQERTPYHAAVSLKALNSRGASLSQKLANGS